MKNKKILAWAMYDWADSAFATTVLAGFFPIFFSSYYSLGQDSTKTTFYLGLANSLASLCISIFAPILGSIADKAGAKKKFIIAFTFLAALNSSLLFVVQSGSWVLALFIFMLANIGFSSCHTFYDSLLPSVASEKEVDFASSLGYSLGYIGGGLLFLVNVFMYLKPALFGLASDVDAIRVSFLMVGIWYIVFALPLFIFVKEDKTDTISIGKAISTGMSDLVVTLKEIRKHKNILMYLLAYWLYIDGVDTIIKMAVDYGSSLGFSSSSLIVALLITQFVAFPSALIYVKVGEKVGVKNAIFIAICAYSVITIIGVFMTLEIHFYILAVCIGLFQGGIQALSRSYYSRLVPKNKEAQFYGFYNMMGKFAAIIGPLLMGVVTLVTKSNRLGIFSVVILFVLGGFFLTKVKDERSTI